MHDIGLRIVRDDDGEVGFEVLVGGGQGRTPMIGKTIRPFLPKPHLLSYLEAILRVYNEYGRRDNMFKARIKILVHEIGVEEFRRRVEEEWEQLRRTARSSCRRARSSASPPTSRRRRSRRCRPVSAEFEAHKREDAAFARWARVNVVPHKQPGYAIVNISLKPTGGVPGDATAEQMDAVADLADRYSFGEIRVTHEQNLTFAARPAGRPLRAVAGAGAARPGHAEHRPGHRHHRLPRPRLLQPRQRPLDPDRAADQPSASPTSPGCTTSAS